MTQQHYKPKPIDKVGRIQIPKYILKMLQIKEGDTFHLKFNPNTKVLTLKLISQKGEIE